MIKYKKIPIDINDETFLIKYNEFWYFRVLLKKISIYYNIRENKKKWILLKIPGTGQFRKINYYIYSHIMNQINEIINIYLKNMFIAK